MNSVRYIGMDVHRDTISVAVLDEDGRVLMQSVLATRADAVLDFVHGVRGRLQVTFEEGRTRRGFTMCWCGGWRSWWCAIRGRMRC